ncbi:hypothetical protein C8R43DRAFT_945344 [Mycena crocata]|nr:hypothetical protein C8R43DRAFT_945344 [Mycena crocata]
MWTKFSHALKSKQAQDGEVNVLERTEVLAGPSTSPSKSTIGRKGVLGLHRDGGSLRLNSPLKLPGIQKVKSTFNLHGNTSQLTLTPERLPESSREMSRRSSQEVLSTSRPKATRRSSFNILTRRPSIDALRSQPATPRSVSRSGTCLDDSSISSNSNHARNRAATFGGSVRSILREPNTPAAGKNVRFIPRDTHDPILQQNSPETSYRPGMARSTPPEDVSFGRLRSASVNSNAMLEMSRFTSSSSRTRRPSVAEIFSFEDPSRLEPKEQAPHLTNFFDKLDAPAISSHGTGLHVPNHGLPDALTSTPFRDTDKGRNGGREMSRSKHRSVQDVTNTLDRGKALQPSASHDRSASFSFGQTVFYPMERSESKRTSSGKSSSKSSSSLASDIESDTRSTSASSSSSASISRTRSISDAVFMSFRGSPASSTTTEPNLSPMDKKDSAGLEPDPFSANARTYYTPQTMIPVTPPQSMSRHARTASKEESIIFSLQTQLDLQNELCGQFEADLRARDELVEQLGKQLVAAEEEDAKKRKFLRAWKKKVAELEKTCRFLEDEVEGSRQESMERSIMDEASSEALRMLHRQIAGLERERDGWRKTETVLREEVRRLEKLVGERRKESAILRESLGSLKGNQKEKELAEEAVKATIVALELRNDEEKQRHKAAQSAWEVERQELLATVDSSKQEIAALDDFKRHLKARDGELAGIKIELSVTRDSAEESLKASEAGKCALAMERDSLKLQVAKLQERNAAVEDNEHKVLELEDEVQQLFDIKKALETEREQLKQERQHALDNVARLDDTIRRRDVEVAQDSQRNLKRIMDAENLREEMGRMGREHSAVLEAALQDATSKQLVIDAQTTTLFDFNLEIERLKGQTRELQQESASKEVQLAQITKQRVQDKRDLEGLNIALDAKQQELELGYGRKYSSASQQNHSTTPRLFAYVTGVIIYIRIWCRFWAGTESFSRRLHQNSCLGQEHAPQYIYERLAEAADASQVSSWIYGPAATQAAGISCGHAHNNLKNAYAFFIIGIQHSSCQGQGAQASDDHKYGVASCGTRREGKRRCFQFQEA